VPRGAPEAGYIYAFVNDNLPDLVKIGYTTGDRDERAKKLSEPSGVPGKFVELCSVYVNDVRAAEKYVHGRLADQRADPRKEFFRVGSGELGRVLNEAQRYYSSAGPSKKASASSTSARSRAHSPDGAVQYLWPVEVTPRIERGLRRVEKQCNQLNATTDLEWTPLMLIATKPADSDLYRAAILKYAATAHRRNRLGLRAIDYADANPKLKNLPATELLRDASTLLDGE
jgi:hypothetical protein